MKGATTNEGILIEFTKPTHISSFGLIGKDGKCLKNAQCYFNGKFMYPDGLPYTIPAYVGQKKKYENFIGVNQKVKTLFVKFNG